MHDMDTAEDGRRENEKDRLIEELREAVRARDEFVSIAAHELRNPMTPILMQVHRLLANARRTDRCRPEILAPQLELLERAVAHSCGGRPLSSTCPGLRRERHDRVNRDRTSRVLCRR